MTREEMRNRVVFHYEQNRGAYPDLLDAAIAIIRGETLEEAAKVADHLNGWGADCGNGGHAIHIAAAIRTLKEGN